MFRIAFWLSGTRWALLPLFRPSAARRLLEGLADTHTDTQLRATVREVIAEALGAMGLASPHPFAATTEVRIPACSGVEGGCIRIQNRGD